MVFRNANKTSIRSEQLHELHAASLRLLSLLTIHGVEEELLQKGIESLTALIGARYGAIGVVDEAGKLQQFVYTGISPEEAARIGHLPEGKGLLGAVIHENHTLRLDDMARDPRAVGFPPNHPPMKSLLAVPVSHGGTVYGRVYLSEKTDGKPFTGEDEQLVARFAESLALTVRFHRTEAERRRAHSILRDVAHAVSAVTGEAFFRTLVQDLAKALQLDYVFVGEVSRHDERIVQTLAFCDHGKIADNIEYQLVPATACGSVQCKAVCHFPKGAQQLYPEDEILSEFRVEAFIGHPLLDASGKVLGLLAVMHGKPIPDHEHVQSLLQICAARAASELERLHTEQGLHLAVAEMRKLASAVAQTDDAIVITDADGFIEYVNPAFERHTGYRREEAVGRTPALVKSGVHDKAFYRVLWGTLKRGEVFRAVFTNRRKNGELFHEEKTITPLKDESGHITHFVSAGRDITERIRSEQALREREAQLARAQQIAHLGNWDWDLVTGKLEWSDETFRIFGLEPQQVVPTAERFLLAVHPDDRERIETTARRAIEQDEPFSLDFRIVVPDGTVRVVHEEAEVVRDPDGKPLCMRGTTQDITARKQAEDQIARLGRILDDSSNEIYIFCAESLRFVQANQGAQRNLGYRMDELKSFTPFDLKPEFTRESFEALIAPLRRGEAERIGFSTVHRRKDGSTYPVEVQLQFMRHETPPVFVAIIQDVTERRAAEARLSYLAYYDSLTGLPNRARLLERLQQAMLDADRVNRLVAVMFLDLDRFKYINDTLGHAAGDGLLKAVAERLKTCVRPGDIIARLGGDEFTVALASVAHADDVARVARKIVDSFAQPFRVGDHALFTTTSVGITLYPFDEQDAEGLLKNADAAMYLAKERGRNNFQFFTAELNVRAERRLRIETALRTALARNELSLHYQPQVDTKTGRITGMEALARWTHPELGNVSPVEFIPVAEETGLILPIGEWVLRSACRQTKAWHATDFSFSKMQVAVNISGKQLRQKDFPDLVRNVLEESGLEARYLDLELTESLLMEDVEGTADAMHALHDMGVSFSVDDFGTGYSSLAYLKRFPIDILKIDRTFVRDIASDPNDVAIVKTIIAMAHTLGMRVVAEGVETRAQLEFLRAQACDGSQGYYCSAPLPAGEFSELLADWGRIRQNQCRRAAPSGKRHVSAKGKARERTRRKPSARRKK